MYLCINKEQVEIDISPGRKQKTKRNQKIVDEYAENLLKIYSKWKVSKKRKKTFPLLN